jgi:hypothetical protein
MYKLYTTVQATFLSFLLIIIVGCGGSDNSTNTSSNSSFSGTLIPLYSYPTDSAWSTLIDTNTSLQTIAIINPNNGPVECNTSITDDYRIGIASLKAHSIKVIGYVYTSYGSRDSITVKGDIDRYRECFSNLDGIFLDETNSSSLSASYYEGLNSYIKESNTSQLSVLNPGVYPDEAIVRASDITVIYEDEGENYDGVTPPAYASQYSPSRFALLGYGISQNSVTTTKLAKLKTARVGYLYLTDDGLGGTNPWDTLSGYYNTLTELLKVQ